MKKSFVSGILIFALLLSVYPLGVMAAGKTEAPNYDEQSIDFALQLGFLVPDENNVLVANQPVTRAEMAMMLVKLIHASATPESQVAISDVDKGSEVYGYIAAAILNGLAGETESGMFHPDEYAYAYQLVDSLIDILGYRRIIEQGSSWIAANRLGLLDGVSLGETEKITKGDAAVILHNAASVDMMIQIQYGSEPEWKQVPGRTIFTEYWKAKKDSGIVDANEYSGLLEGKNTKKGYVSIDGRTFDAGSTVAAELLGYGVEYYYTTEDDRLIFVQKQQQNQSVKITANNIKEVTHSEMMYYADESSAKTKTVKFADGVDVLYNRRALFDYDAADLKPQTGYVELIDNNGDNRYEVISISEYKNYYVTSVDSNNSLVADGLRGVTLDFSSSARDMTEIKSWQQDSNKVTAATFGILGPRTVISVMESKDGKLMTVISSAGKVLGEIESIRERDGKLYCTIEGAEYAVSDDYAGEMKKENSNMVTPKIGLSARFFLDFNGEIAYINTELSDWSYGLVTYAKLEGSFQKNLKIRMMNTESIWETYEAATSVRVNGEMEKKHTNIYQNLTGGVDKPVPQIVRYKLNTKSQIAALDIAVDMSGVADYIGYDETRFTLDAKLINKQYKSNGKLFDKQYGIDPATSKLFYVPRAVYDANGRVDEEKVFAMSYTFFSNDRNYSLDIYEADAYKVAAAAILTGESTVMYETEVLYINEVAEGYDVATGNLIYTIRGYQKSNEISYVLKDETLAKSIQPGDAVKINLFADGSIRNLVRIANFNNIGLSSSVAGIAKNGDYASDNYFTIHVATVYNVDYDRNAFVTYLDNPSKLLRYAGSNLRIIRWDTKKKEFSSAGITEAIGQISSNTPTRVLIHERYNEPYSAVIINE